MRKRTWFIIIVALVAFIVLALSRFVAGFDEAANSMVVQPLVAIWNNFVVSVTSHPTWMGYGYHICFTGGIVATCLFAFFIWPRPRPHIKEALPFAHKQTTSTSSSLGTHSTTPVGATTRPDTQKTVVPASPKSEIAEVVEEEGV